MSGRMNQAAISLMFCLCAGIAAFGQAPPSPRPCLTSPPQVHEECRKQQDPFASYCEDVYRFLDVAACHHLKDAEGRDTERVDRSDRSEVFAAMKPFLDLSGAVGLGSDPTRFSSLRASDIALEDAVGK